MKTVECKLATKYKMFPSGIVPIDVSDVDAEWIQTLPIMLGVNNHPIAPVGDPSTWHDRSTFKSLARLVLWRHGAPAEDQHDVYRVDIDRPLDVSHENICVPPSLVKQYSFLDDIRSIPLSDYLHSFPQAQQAPLIETTPIKIGCICADTIQRVWLDGDADDAIWLEHRLVRFNADGKLFFQNDDFKFVSVIAEQARRALKLERGTTAYFHWVKPTPATDIRKCRIVVRVKNRLFRGMVEAV